MRVVMRFLSILATVTLLSSAYLTPAYATGTSSLQEISTGVRMLGETVRSTEITDNVGWIILGFLGLGLLIGHFGGGFIGVFVGLIGLGFWWGSQQIAESIGWRALGM